MTAADPWYGSQPATARPDPKQKKRYPLWNGEYVRLRGPQMIVHGTIAALIFGCLISGLYFGALQVNWHIPGAGPHVYLKTWWDAGRFWPRQLGHWPLYRHTAFRDQAIPEVATIGVLTLIAQPRYWDVRVSTARLAVSPFVLLAGVFALGVLGVWLNLIGLPWAWAHAWTAAGRPGYNLDRTFAWAARYSVFVLVWGFLAGKLLHRWWAPAGATVQGFILDRLADISRDRTRATGRESIPLWVRFPVAAPVLRERFSHLYRLPDAGQPLVRGGRVKRIVLTAGIAAGVYLIILGFLGHYIIGVAHVRIPYLTSP